MKVKKSDYMLLVLLGTIVLFYVLFTEKWIPIKQLVLSFIGLVRP